MRITRTSLAKRYVQRTIAEGHGSASRVGGPGPDGAHALTFGWTIRTEEDGKSVQYTASVTEAELDALLALRARLKTAGRVDPERASPELIAAVGVRLDRLDQGQAHRKAQLRGDGSPNQTPRIPDRKELTMLRVEYQCPQCGNRWAENLECGHDGECPECGQGDIVAEGWTQLTPEQEAESQRPKPWLVSRTVLECLFIEAQNEREAIEAAIGIEAGWTRSIDREDYDCTPPPAGGFILGLPIV